MIESSRQRSQLTTMAAFLIGTALISMGACSTQGDLPAAAPTPTIQPTSTPVSVPPFKPVMIDIESYEALPGETIHLLEVGLQGEVVEGLSIGVGVTWLTDTVDDTGQSGEKWQAGVWIDNALCPSAGQRTITIGDIIDFAGYQIRIVDIVDDAIVVATSGQLASPEEIAAACITSPHNHLPGEQVVDLFYKTQDSFESGTIEFGGPPWTEAYTDVNGEVVEGLAVDLKIVTQSETWEGIVHDGDTIECGGYRFRISSIIESSVRLIWGRVD